MSTALKLIYNLSRYWRCYFLLLVASILSFILIYISKNDPNLEHYFPYFRGGSNYNYYYSNGNIEEIAKLMQINVLDYEFIHPNSRYCLKKFDSTNKNKKENDDNFVIDNELIGKDPESYELDFILLSVSQAANFKYRSAARSTWAKHLSKLNSRLVFLIGNPAYDSDKEAAQQANSFDRSKLKKEMRDYADIVQINMPDGDNYTSTKTLLGLSWTVTYCSFAKNVFVLSDTAILNHQKFDSFLRENLTNIPDNQLIGYCNYTDEKLPNALRYFYANKVQKNPKIKAKIESNKTQNSLDNYTGRFCSSLGFILSINAAKKLWMTALRTPFIMKLSPAYLNGYLAHLANLNHSNWLTYFDYVPSHSNCLKVFDDTNPNAMLCAENFNISGRYTSYIATWNSGSRSGLGILIKH